MAEEEKFEGEAPVLENETQFPKERKDIVEYRTGEPGQDCVSCEWFKEPESCEKVLGQIYRSGTCNLFEAQGADGLDAEGLEGLDAEAVEDFLFTPEEI